MKFKKDLLEAGFMKSNSESNSFYSTRKQYKFRGSLLYLYVQPVNNSKWTLIYFRNNSLNPSEIEIYNLFAGNIENYEDFKTIMKSWKHLKEK
jgi:hypothetical protein